MILIIIFNLIKVTLNRMTLMQYMQISWFTVYRIFLVVITIWNIIKFHEFKLDDLMVYFWLEWKNNYCIIVFHLWPRSKLRLYNIILDISLWLGPLNMWYRYLAQWSDSDTTVTHSCSAIRTVGIQASQHSTPLYTSGIMRSCITTSSTIMNNNQQWLEIPNIPFIKYTRFFMADW